MHKKGEVRHRFCEARVGTDFANEDLALILQKIIDFREAYYRREHTEEVWDTGFSINSVIGTISGSKDDIPELFGSGSREDKKGLIPVPKPALYQTKNPTHDHLV